MWRPEGWRRVHRHWLRALSTWPPVTLGRMQRRDRDTTNVLSLLAALVGTAMVMGLLAAGIMIPAVGAAGAAAKQGVNLFDSLPGEFQQSPLAQQSRIVDAKGGLITTPY